MRRRNFCLAATGALAGCSYRRLPRLNVYNWDNYVAAKTIGDFERRFQCHVRYGVYASAEEMLAKVMSGNSGWDVVFPSNSFVGPMRELDLLIQLDRERIPNLKNLEPQFQRPDWDPGLEHCIPYMHSATGILYSKRQGHQPEAWADLWNDTYGRRVTMLDDPAEVFGAALKRLGKSINATDEATLQQARDLAIAQKPFLRAYLNEEVRDQVIAGDVLAAQMWAQVAQAAMNNAPDLSFSYPREGFALYADNMCILRESKHVDMAYHFLNYMLEAQVAAAIGVEITGATTNAAAKQLLPEKLRSNPVLYPPPEIAARGEWFQPLPPAAQRLRDRYWTEIKSA